MYIAADFARDYQKIHELFLSSTLFALYESCYWLFFSFLYVLLITYTKKTDGAKQQDGAIKLDTIINTRFMCILMLWLVFSSIRTRWLNDGYITLDYVLFESIMAIIIICASIYLTSWKRFLLFVMSIACIIVVLSKCTSSHNKKTFDILNIFPKQLQEFSTSDDIEVKSGRIIEPEIP